METGSLVFSPILNAELGVDGVRIASIFVKGVSSRDGLKLIFAGMLGGYIGGQIGAFMDIPQNLWWMREVIKLLLTIGSLNLIHKLGILKKRG